MQLISACFHLLFYIIYKTNQQIYVGRLFLGTPVQLLVNKISIQPITWHQLSSFRHGQDDRLKFKLTIRMRKRGEADELQLQKSTPAAISVS